MATTVRLLVGLGNPGSRYEGTRHNAGFRFADRVARAHGGTFRSQSRFSGELCEVQVGVYPLRLLKPATYMNASGRSVAAVAGYFRLEVPEILVVHDEIDLPPGQIRLKRGGGHGGHNGLRDVIPALGSADFLRLRVGVGHPGDADRVVGYVLERAPAAEQALVDEGLDRALALLPGMVAGDHARVMNELHRREPPVPANG
jgi:peptidyl-tRNA hydrolase, PTH1 family